MYYFIIEPLKLRGIVIVAYLCENYLMITGGKGGANTKTGLVFEGRVDVLEVFKRVPGYTVHKDGTILFKDKPVAQHLRKNLLYKFLENKGVDYKDILSKKLLPDDAIYVPSAKTLYVIEMKFQKVAGSVDEKLQTCDFKKKQYMKLMDPLKIKVDYIYVLNDWFTVPAYRDVLGYIKEVGCDYYFNEISLNRLDLPSEK